MKIIQIENKSGKVKLTDAIMPWSVEKLTEDIGKLFGAKASAEGADFGVITNFAENAVDTLEIEINSPGGSIFDGYNIYNEIMSLRERGVVVTATVTGMAASMASVICMACNVIRMVPHGKMMIHEASQGVRGNADELRKAADLLDGLSSDIAQIYANRTGKPLEEMRELMKRETWMSAKEAVTAGFANEVFDIRAEAPKSVGMNLLKMIFPGNEAEISKIEAALVEADSLREDLIKAESRITELSGLAEANASLQGEVASLTTAKADLDAALVTASAELAAKDAEIESVTASIPLKITEALAAIGQPEPLAIESKPTEEIKSLTGFSKVSAFFAKTK
jgi:ATP-dependent Clp endopeptidase proteolytic subunit ClpP